MKCILDSSEVKYFLLQLTKSKTQFVMLCRVEEEACREQGGSAGEGHQGAEAARDRDREEGEDQAENHGHNPQKERF